MAYCFRLQVFGIFWIINSFFYFSEADCSCKNDMQNFIWYLIQVHCRKLCNMFHKRIICVLCFSFSIEKFDLDEDILAFKYAWMLNITKHSHYNPPELGPTTFFLLHRSCGNLAGKKLKKARLGEELYLDAFLAI